MLKSAALALLLLSTTQASARSLKEIKKSNELRICFSHSPGIVSAEPPDCTTECKWSGPAYEIVQAFAKHLGKSVKMTTRNVEWDLQFADDTGKIRKGDTYTPKYLKEGLCDIYPSNLTRNEWRENLMDFAILFPSRMTILVRATDRSQFKTEKDLGGKVAVIKADTSFETWITEVNKTTYKDNPIKASIIDFTKDEYRLLEDGSGDFSLADADTAFNLTNHNYKKLAGVLMVGDTDEIGWGMAKADKDLIAEANAFFKAQRRSGESEINKVWQKFFGMPIQRFEALVKALQ